MTDLISRQAALDIVFDFAETPHKMYQQIRELPTIDPVKHGKWYITEDMPYFGHIQEYLTCSACEGRFHGTGVEEWDYCPNCGARMDGGEV